METAPIPGEEGSPRSSCLLWVLLAGVGCLVVCGGGGGTLLWYGWKKYVRPVMALVERQNEAIRAGRPAEAYACMTEGYRRTVSQAEFERFVRENPKAYPGTFEFGGIEGGQSDPNVWTLSGTLKGAGGEQRVEYRIVRQGADWAIETISLQGGARSPAPPRVGVALSREVSVKKEAQGGGVRVTFETTSAGFQAAPDGKPDLVLDLALKDPAGKEVARRAGAAAWTAAASADQTVTWKAWVDLPGPPVKGTWQLELTLHDKLARTKVSQTYPVELDK